MKDCIIPPLTSTMSVYLYEPRWHGVLVGLVYPSTVDSCIK